MCLHQFNVSRNSYKGIGFDSRHSIGLNSTYTLATHNISTISMTDP